jgi:hypothetical protein
VRAVDNDAGDGIDLQNYSGTSLLFARTDGYVGIGTTSPDYKLDVGGVIRGQSETGSGDVLLVGNDAKIVDIDIADTLGIYSQTSPTIGSIKLGSGGGTISGYSGNVGIGTTGPVSKLHIPSIALSDAASGLTLEGTWPWTYYKDTETDQSSWVNYIDGNNYYIKEIAYADRNNASLYAVGNIRMTVATGGNVTVAGDLTVSGGDISITNNNGGIDFNDASAYWLKTATNWGIYWDTTNNILAFHGAGTDRANIDLDDGNIQMDGNLTVGGSYIYGAYGTIAASYDEWLRINPDSNHTNGVYVPTLLRADGGLYVSDDEYIYASAEDVIRTGDSFIVDGNVGIGTTSPTATLDVHGNVTIGAYAYSNAPLNFWADTTSALIESTRSDNTAPGIINSNGWGSFYTNKGFGIGGDPSPGAGTVQLYVSSSIGIGTTSPAANIDIAGSGGGCTGTPQACSTFTCQYPACGGQQGCSSSTYDCMGKNYAQCNACPSDCYWNGDYCEGTYDSCTGAATACTSFGSPSACAAQAGCSWSYATKIRLDSDTYATNSGWVDGSNRDKKENFISLSDVLMKKVKLGTWTTSDGSVIDAIEYNNDCSPNCCGEGCCKEQTVNLDDEELLRRLSLMPVMRWNFIGESLNNIGPAAQDFYKLFGLGAADTQIKATNMAGVALAGVKALNGKIDRVKNILMDENGLINIRGSPDSPGLVIDNLGNVGIGTTASLSYKFTVGGTASISEDLYVGNKICIGETCMTEENLKSFLGLNIASSSGAIEDNITITSSILPTDFLTNLVNGLAQLGVSIKDGIITAIKLVVEEVQTKILRANVISISVEEGKDNVVGFATIPPDSMEYQVKNSLVQANSKIFISFTSNTAGRTWYVSEKTPGTGFTIRLSEVTTELLSFDYWILLVEGQPASSSDQSVQPPIEEPVASSSEPLQPSAEGEGQALVEPSTPAEVTASVSEPPAETPTESGIQAGPPNSESVGGELQPEPIASPSVQ